MRMLSGSPNGSQRAARQRGLPRVRLTVLDDNALPTGDHPLPVASDRSGWASRDTARRPPRAYELFRCGWRCRCSAWGTATGTATLCVRQGSGADAGGPNTLLICAYCPGMNPGEPPESDWRFEGVKNARSGSTLTRRSRRDVGAGRGPTSSPVTVVRRRRRCRRSADLQLPASPPGDRHEEHRELFDQPHPRPLRGVAAARAGADVPRAQGLLLGAEAEQEEHGPSLGSGLRRAPGRRPPVGDRRTTGGSGRCSRSRCPRGGTRSMSS
jgi:hypothetical protein